MSARSTPSPTVTCGDSEEDEEDRTSSEYVAMTAKYQRGAQLLGRGTFSSVFLGTAAADGAPVAIKVVPASCAPDIAREVSVMKDLGVSHPSLLRLLDAYTTPKHVFIVMEHAAGGELFDFIRERGWLSDREACIAVHNILDGVAFIHSRGLIHRDLKPQNLLCRTQDPTSVCIADFGLSKLLNEGSFTQTYCGSPHYLAPEVLRCEPYTSKVDVWAVGIVAFVALCGCLPFYDDDLRKLVQAVLRAQFVWPDDVEVSSLAKDFVGRLLERNPDRRPTATEALLHPWVARVGSAAFELGSPR